MKESSHTCAHMNKSSHTHTCVMSHYIWMGHVTHIFRHEMDVDSISTYFPYVDAKWELYIASIHISRPLQFRVYIL